MDSEADIQVLDKGFVRLVDHMGTDGDIVAAARVSISGGGVKAQSEDRALLRYLMRHRHTTPFEMTEVKFHVKAPIFVARQWFRHRTLSYNEMSGRYSELPDETYLPDPERVGFQSKKNKQGTSGRPHERTITGFINMIRSGARRAFDDYKVFLGKERYANDESSILGLRSEIEENGGIARELARINLPVSTYTEFYVKGNLWNWLRFLGLRKDSHAQYEIRVFADAIGEVIEGLFPLTWEAWNDYSFESITLSRLEIQAFKTLFTMKTNRWSRIDIIKSVKEIIPNKREYSEFAKKSELLGYVLEFD